MFGGKNRDGKILLRVVSTVNQNKGKGIDSMGVRFRSQDQKKTLWQGDTWTGGQKEWLSKPWNYLGESTFQAQRVTNASNWVMGSLHGVLKGQWTNRYGSESVSEVGRWYKIMSSVGLEPRGRFWIGVLKAIRGFLVEGEGDMITVSY